MMPTPPPRTRCLPGLVAFAPSTARTVAAMLAALLVAGVGMPPRVANAQFDLALEQKLLLDLLRDGKYRQALSEVKRIEKNLRPTKKNPGVGPATRIYVDLLIYQGTIERRMGDLDAADKTLTEAFTISRDPAYQQFIARSTPADEKEQQAFYLGVELPFLQLLDNGIEVLLERIHTANQRLRLRSAAGEQAPARPAAGAEPAGADADAAVDRDQIVGWFRRVDELIRMSQTARSSLRGQFAETGGQTAAAGEAAALAGSPQARVLASMSRPYRHVGMRYLEASRLPWTLSFDSDSPPEDVPDGRATKAAATRPDAESADERASQSASQRLRAKAYLEKSLVLAEQAMGPVGEAIAQGGAAAQEAARIRAERHVPLAEVALLDADLDAARRHVDTAIESLRRAEPPRHPELARPLIVSAEVAFAESRRSLADNNAVAARDQATAAVESLREAQQLLTAKDSAFDPEAPLHLLLSSQLAVAESFAKSSSQTAAATTAADAAARRALAAMKTGTKPKPATPPGTPATPTAPTAPGTAPQPPGAAPKPPAPPVVPKPGPAQVPAVQR